MRCRSSPTELWAAGQGEGSSGELGKELCEFGGEGMRRGLSKPPLLWQGWGWAGWEAEGGGTLVAPELVPGLWFPWLKVSCCGQGQARCRGVLGAPWRSRCCWDWGAGSLSLSRDPAPRTHCLGLHPKTAAVLHSSGRCSFAPGFGRRRRGRQSPAGGAGRGVKLFQGDRGHRCVAPVCRTGGSGASLGPAASAGRAGEPGGAE